MSRDTELFERINDRLSTETVDFITMAGKIARERHQKLYLVGGVVRDMLLERDNFDLDLVVEGDAVSLAEEMARLKNGKITPHKRFGTAKISWDKRSVDLATARRETYARPGALPKVKPGSIDDDLFRRDFTINAMAIELNPDSFGKLLDLYGGVKDLEQKLVRVLHEKSFIDDATRIWRALRYEQRLGFNLEASTLALLKNNITMLDTISGDRIRHELELVLKEEYPENTLRRADELGVLKHLHPSLKADVQLAETLTIARESNPEHPAALYLALLTYRLDKDEIEQIIASLKLPKATARILRHTGDLKARIKELDVHGLAPGHIFSLLHGYDTVSLTANSLASESRNAIEHIDLYQNVLRHVRTATTGADLKKLGVPEGPKIREILGKLLEARLDGKVASAKEEEAMVRELLGK